jgi:hypothetical protein
MQLNIDDSLSGAERRKKIRYDQISYAMRIHNNNKRASARWLGISIRTMRNWCRGYPEFRPLEIKRFISEHMMKHLPKTFEEARKHLFYRCGDPDAKETIKRHYGII